MNDGEKEFIIKCYNEGIEAPEIFKKLEGVSLSDIRGVIFNYRKRTKEGAKRRKYFQKNKKIFLEKAKKYHDELNALPDEEKIKKRKEWRKKNRQKINDHSKAYYLKNKSA